MERTGVRLLWGTANLFSHPRYAAGAATNPDPEVFAVAAAQVCHALEATKALGGANYVLWGGREGYETLLNTDLAREEAQLARFLHLVVEHKHRIGFEGTILIEPKPAEPTKHQYDHDAATVAGFLARTASWTRSDSTWRPTTPRWPGTASTTRWPPPSPPASWAPSTPTAVTRRTAGTPTSSPTRSRSARSPSTRSWRRAASPPGGSTSTPSSAASRWPGTTCSSATSVRSTPWPARCWPPRRWSSRVTSPASGRSATPGGTARSARPYWPGTPPWTRCADTVVAEGLDPVPRLGPPGAPRTPRQPARGAGPVTPDPTPHRPPATSDLRHGAADEVDVRRRQPVRRGRAARGGRCRPPRGRPGRSSTP